MYSCMDVGIGTVNKLCSCVGMDVGTVNECVVVWVWVLVL